jgi:hypothetical protein
VPNDAGNPIRSYHLDNILFGADIRLRTVVKLDIEGVEAAALAGATGLLTAQQAQQMMWFVALHSCEPSEPAWPTLTIMGIAYYR